MRLLALFLVTLLLLPSLAGAADMKLFPYPTHVEVLDNGLQVILVPMSSNGLVAYWTIVRTGARDEIEVGRTGFAHFFEHMMFRGTERFPADVYNAKITEIGADANAFTSDDFTAYHLGIAKDDLEWVMDLESDRFRNLRYALPEFQTEAGAVYGEYRKLRSNPFFTINEALRNAAFDAHTYKHTAMGFVEDIQRMPELFEHSRSFFSRFYRPENSILLLVGDFDIAKTRDLVKKLYLPWQKGYERPMVAPEPEQKAERRIDVPYEGRSLPIVWLAYKNDAYDPTSRRQAAMQLLCELAFGETSDLHRKLVLEEQLVEFVACDSNQNRDPQLIDLLTRVKDPTKVDIVISRIEAGIAHFQTEKVEAARLSELQARVKYQFLMSLETPMSVARALVPYLGTTGDPRSVEAALLTAAAVTPADIQEAARHYFVKERRTLAILRGTN